MDNEQILNKRWQEVDKYLLKYQKQYRQINSETRDKIQELFDSIEFSYRDINKFIPKAKKNRLDKKIKEWSKQGLLNEYFGYKAKLALSKKNITYAEWLEIMVQGIYMEEVKEMTPHNDKLFYSVCEDSYNQGIKEFPEKYKKRKPFNLHIYYAILNIPILTMAASEYIRVVALDNAENLYKKTLANIQLNKKLDVDNAFYKELFKKQNNSIININNDKLSGAVVNIVEGLTNLAYLQAGLENDVIKCRFVAVVDERTTKMCKSLNNQIFTLRGLNIYKRYSDFDKRIITYRTMGLAKGENLPPIDNHFHRCRSTITYQI